MLVYQFRPLSPDCGIPRFRSRKSSPFRAKWSATLDLLESELVHLKGKELVLQADVRLDEIRNDGMLRADARPATPRVILSFESKYGPLSYPSDAFLDWQSNVRAIALSLEALRTVDRYGVTQRAEQYRGWQQLPPPEPPKKNDRFMLIYELSRLVGMGVSEVEADLAAAIKAARIKYHPDRGVDLAVARRIGEIAGALGF